ncbi:hypothetical protein G7046_g8285 [Stylonectria norvegica]|nr:hypothetical protein G7046_g8285 [Stylonectria norvegica]
MSTTKTIAFLGASTGCGLSALQAAIAAGHTCIALCRTPSKMDTHFPSKPVNLIVKPGNAHDVVALSTIFTVPNDPTRLVDAISFSIGGAWDSAKWGLDDPDVCRKGIAAVLEALASLRRGGARGQPLVTVVSSTGISKHGRDVPLLFLPMYKILLKTPHEDKKIMEQRLVESSERWVVVRASWLVDGANPERQVRVGVEDPKKGVEQKQVGYTISREAVGAWIYENLLAVDPVKYERKAVAITW